MNILATFLQKVKVSKESILNHIVPRQIRPGGRGGRGSCVIVVESIADGLRMGLQCCGNMFPKLVSYIAKCINSQSMYI